MSFISGTVAGIKAADAQKDANEKNLRAAQQTNNTNFILDLVRRGLPIPESIPGLRIPGGAAGVSSAILPFYLSGAERNLGNYASNAFGALTRVPTEDELARFGSIASSYRPTFDAGTGVVRDIFSGALTERELADAQPVAAARIKLAGARKDASMEAIEEKLNEIKAIQGRKGFAGDSSASQRLRFDATRKIFGDAAVDMSEAELANAMDTRAIRKAGGDRMIQSLDVPLRRAQQEFQLEDLPAQAVRDRAERNISVFNPFRLTGGFQPIQRPPEVGAVPSNFQLAAQGTAALGQAVGNYFAGGNYARQPQQAQPYFTNANAYGTYGSRTPAQQANFNAAQNYYEDGTVTGYSPSNSSAGL